MPTMTVYGDSKSGNCLKVKWAADHLRIPYEWVELDILTGATREERFLAMNPAAQVPTVVLPDGRALAQSNAIVLHLAEGTPLVPEDGFLRAKVFEWLFWEQYSHEPYIAVRRFQMAYLGKQAEELEPRLLERGEAALARMEAHLQAGGWLVGDSMTVADIALLAYTRVAHEGGFNLGGYPAVRTWVGRAEAALGLKPA